MDESVVHQCAGCGTSIDPDEPVTEFIERRINTVGGADVEARLWHYAHAGHEALPVARGYHRTDRGTLRSLRAKHRDKGSDRPAGSA